LPSFPSVQNNGWFYLNREKREMSRKGRGRFRVFWRFSRFKIMAGFYNREGREGREGGKS
jgi:hypothetical protein